VVVARIEELGCKTKQGYQNREEGKERKKMNGMDGRLAGRRRSLD